MIDSIAENPAESITRQLSVYVPIVSALVNVGDAAVTSSSRPFSVSPFGFVTVQAYWYGGTPPSTTARSAARPPPATTSWRSVVTSTLNGCPTRNRIEPLTCCPTASLTAQVAR